MKRTLIASTLILGFVLSFVPQTEAARRDRRVRVTRTRVVVRPGFPIRRTLPQVVIRPAPVVRVTPRVYLGPVAFAAVAVATLPAPDARVWSGQEELEREDGWTEFTLNADRRGDRMVLEIEQGRARISFAEVVFENGEAQVVDFNEKVLGPGIYRLLDFKDGRKVDHVRIIAQAESRESEIRLHLLS